jgi:hypothetical protein
MYNMITVCTRLIPAKFFERTIRHRGIKIGIQRYSPLLVNPSHRNDLLQVQAFLPVIDIIKDKAESKLFCYGR